MKNVIYDITFETKCYENDWEYLLKTNYLDKQIKYCNVVFSNKQLIINNVNDKNKVSIWAQKKKDNKIIDNFYFVDDYIDEALKHFNISKDSFGKGYYYSSAELVGLYLSKSKYHLHFSSDSFMIKNKHNWIIEACEILENNPNISVANPVWNFSFNSAMDEASGNKINNFFIGYGFSDQCYFVRTDEFKGNIYNFSHPESDRYPKYGGELFEKRIDAYMRVNKKNRITSTETSYVHNNFPKLKLLKKIIIYLLNINIYIHICIMIININKVYILLKKLFFR